MKTLLAALLCAGLIVSGNFATAQETPDLEGVKCVVLHDNDVNPEKSAEHLEGKVWFCCDNCKSKFEADPDAYATMANHQLVATEQYEQKACPITGREVADGVTAKVGEVEVGLCCKNCQKKVNDAADLAAKAELVFSKDAFEKGFEPVEDEVNVEGVQCIMMDMEVSADNTVAHRDGQLYFCCKRCMAGYNADPSAHAAKANRQLVETGQYTQTACPFSGGDVAEGTEITIGEVKIGFCCNGCKTKAEGAADDDAKIEMIFNDKSFEKGFAKK
jgi:YHS domain-containing protein